MQRLLWWQLYTCMKVRISLYSCTLRKKRKTRKERKNEMNLPFLSSSFSLFSSFTNPKVFFMVWFGFNGVNHTHHEWGWRRRRRRLQDLRGSAKGSLHPREGSLSLMFEDKYNSFAFLFLLSISTCKSECM